MRFWLLTKRGVGFPAPPTDFFAKDADHPDIPILKQATAEYAKLQ